MNLDSLQQLQTRIRNASGADRELDVAIACALLGGVVHSFRTYERFISPDEAEDGRASIIPTPHYTTYPDGLGACVGLLHAQFPEWKWERYFNGYTVVGRYSTEDENPRFGAQPLANDCLTFIDAIVAAKISELEARQQETTP